MIPTYYKEKIEDILRQGRRSGQRLYNFVNTNSFALRLHLNQPARLTLLLWPAFWGAAVGQGTVLEFIAIAFVALMLKMAACMYEDMLTPNETENDDAWSTLLLALLVGGALWLSLLVAPVCLFFGLLWLIFSAVYPFLRRTTWAPQLYAGFIYGLFPVIIGAGVADSFDFSFVTLTIAGFLWAVAGETLYANANTEQDLAHGLKSIALLLGEHSRLFVVGIGSLCLLAFFLTGVILSAGGVFYFSLMLTEGLFIYAALKHEHNPQQILPLGVVAGCLMSVGFLLA